MDFTQQSGEQTEVQQQQVYTTQYPGRSSLSSSNLPHKLPHLLQVVTTRSSSEDSIHTKDAYDVPEVTFNIYAERLEVLSEMLVDFDNMKINGIDLLFYVRFQGCETYFNRL